MFASLKSVTAVSLGLLALGVANLGLATPASADRGGDIAAGIIGGAIVGGIIGQASPRPVYVEPRPVYVEPRGYRGCGELRDRIAYFEDSGRFERAREARREYRYRCGD